MRGALPNGNGKAPSDPSEVGSSDATDGSNQVGLSWGLTIHARAVYGGLENTRPHRPSLLLCFHPQFFQG